MKTRNTILRLSIAYIIMLALFLSALFATHYIPKERILTHAQESSNIILTEGTYHNPFNNIYLRLDNFTDALMIDIALSADSKNPIKASMQNVYMRSQELEMPVALTKLAYGEKKVLSPKNYFRYWHGNQILLRPLLTVTNINGIRVLNCILFSLLSLLLFYFLNKKTDITTTILFLLAIYAFIIPAVPLSMQYTTCFLIALLSSLAILICPTLTKSRTYLAVTFFCIGGLTSFFDLFTTPIITLGLPVTIAILLNRQNEITKLSIATLCWALGYGLIWASKWVIGSLITGLNIFEDALNKAGYRMSTELQSADTLANSDTRLIMICILAILWLSLFASYIIKRINKKHNWLLALSLYAPTWYAILYNHSFVHRELFTWRSLTVSLLALMMFILLLIKDKKNENSNTDSLLQRKQDNRQSHI